MPKKKKEKGDYLVVECPHCKEPMQLFKTERKCGVFRHGFLKSNGKNIAPHASQKRYEAYVKSGRIYGCGKPFRMTLENKAEACGYI